ncbi:hypothetical protein [Ekhidna sp.]|uniref:hypothetical protein n=1 Tax=Ekhidna sp. TaxID=2608089 RepID=UPI0032EACB46
MSLSKKASDMLDYNGYRYKKDNHLILFRKAGTDRVGLTIVIIVSLVFVGLIFALQWWAGLIALIVAFLIFRPLVKRIPGSLKLVIDPEKKIVEIDNRTRAYNFDQIFGIYIHSKFVDEYSSAFKSTSEEHQITIGLELDNQKLAPLFKLISDHAKPSKEMNEVYDFLESSIKAKNFA